MIPSLNTTPEGSFVHPRDPGEFAYGTATPRMSVSVEEAKILSWLARGCVVIEIGTGLAVSTRALAERAQIVSTVDNDPWVHSTIWPLLEHTPRVVTFTSIPENHVRADLVFIDGDHRAPGVERDIASVKPFCRPDTLVVFHDVKYSNVGDVVRAASRVMRKIDTVHGLGLVWASDLI